VRWSYDPGVEQDSGAEPAVDSDLRKLRCFIAVAERCTAQPALSRQIERLEEQLGVALFARTSRSVELTDAGRELVS
jgi:DNA-binding transcriptional LysR family regulator